MGSFGLLRHENNHLEYLNHTKKPSEQVRSLKAGEMYLLLVTMEMVRLVSCIICYHDFILFLSASNAVFPMTDYGSCCELDMAAVQPSRKCE